MVSEEFREAILRFRLKGGRLWQLALQHNISPSLFSATLTGARRCTYDERIVNIGVSLGLRPDAIFVESDEVVAP